MALKSVESVLGGVKAGAAAATVVSRSPKVVTVTRMTTRSLTFQPLDSSSRSERLMKSAQPWYLEVVPELTWPKVTTEKSAVLSALPGSWLTRVIEYLVRSASESPL